MRDVCKLPGVTTFRSTFQPGIEEQHVITINACSSCAKDFIFSQTTSWPEIDRIIEQHRLLCDEKRAAASARAKKRWDKEKNRQNSQSQPLEVTEKKRKPGAEQSLVQKRPKKICRRQPEREALEDPWAVKETIGSESVSERVRNSEMPEDSIPPQPLRSEKRDLFHILNPKPEGPENCTALHEVGCVNDFQRSPALASPRSSTCPVTIPENATKGEGGNDGQKDPRPVASTSSNRDQENGDQLHFVRVSWKESLGRTVERLQDCEGRKRRVTHECRQRRPGLSSKETPIPAMLSSSGPSLFCGERSPIPPGAKPCFMEPDSCDPQVLAI
ncbi:hypothetical protein APHAL10511_000719 [Amanita phalloides]|nr:hypothetical protein APHAL10511_000719 [Amanita phalloides]